MDFCGKLAQMVLYGGTCQQFQKAAFLKRKETACEFWNNPKALG